MLLNIKCLRRKTKDFLRQCRNYNTQHIQKNTSQKFLIVCMHLIYVAPYNGPPCRGDTGVSNLENKHIFSLHNQVTPHSTSQFAKGCTTMNICLGYLPVKLCFHRSSLQFWPFFVCFILSPCTVYSLSTKILIIKRTVSSQQWVKGSRNIKGDLCLQF